MSIKIANLEIGQGQPLLIIAGPCVIESYDLIYNTARALKDIAHQVGCALVFKSSFDKANRTAIDSFRGPGLEKGLEMLAAVKRELDLPLLTDVHEVHQCGRAGQTIDVLQIPAFLCRQTDLIVAAARTGKAVNIKKGQFVSPSDVLHSIAKATDSGNANVFVTERGTAFGYNNLVVDFRAIPTIQQAGWPVVFDATHSVQQPGGGGGFTSGQRQFVPTLAKAAIAAGCQGIFMEVHPDPDRAKSDAANQVPLSQVKELLLQLVKLHKLVSTMEDIQLPEFGKCPVPVA